MMRIATLVMAGALIGFAQQPAQPLPRHALKALNLTAAQKQQARSIFQEARQNAQPIRQQLRQNREAMNAAIQSNNTAEIQRLAGLQGNLESQAIAGRAQAMAKFYSTLTPEQAAQLKQMKTSRRAMRMKAKV